MFGTITGRDPRSLGDHECSGYELGLARAQVKALQQVAFDELAAAGLARLRHDHVQAGAAGALCCRPLAASAA